MTTTIIDVNGFRFNALDSSTFRRILRNTGLSQRKTLDVGCGYGEHLIHFGRGSVGLTTTISEVEFGRKSNFALLGE